MTPGSDFTPTPEAVEAATQALNEKSLAFGEIYGDRHAFLRSLVHLVIQAFLEAEGLEVERQEVPGQYQIILISKWRPND